MPTWIDSLTLRTLDSDRQAEVAIASVPLPREEHAVVTLKGMASQAVPIAWYPGGQGGPGGVRLPRQVLVMGIGGAGDSVLVEQAAASDVVAVDRPTACPVSDAKSAGPRWSSGVVAEKKLGLSMSETNEFNLEHNGRQIGIRMGVEFADGGFHWWEWLQVEQLWAGPVCTAVRAAGYIPITEVSEEEMFEPSRYNRGDWLHKHNWLFAEVYAQVFVNGLVRVTARHVNNRFFDQGRDLAGFVPVIGFSGPGLGDTPAAALDGSRTDFTLGSGSSRYEVSPRHTHGRDVRETVKQCGGSIRILELDEVVRNLRGDPH